MTIWLDAAYGERCFQASILILTAHAVVRRKLARPTLVIAALGAIALWGPLQLAMSWSVYQYETWVAALRWTTFLAVFFLAFEAFQESDLRRSALTALALFGAVLAALSTLQAYSSHGNYFWLFESGQPDVFGPFQSRNNYASFIELTLPLVLWEGLGRGQRRSVWLALAGMMAASVIASGSRAGSALVLAEIPAVLVVAWLRRQLPGRQLATVGAIVLAAVAVWIGVTGWETLERKLGAADPFVNRREMLQSATAMVHDRPWTGFGLGSFPTVYPAYAVFDIGFFVNHAHNDWAEWASEGGLPFLLLLAGLATVSTVPAIRSGWGLGLIAVYAHAFVDYPMQRTGLAIWVFVIGAALAAETMARAHKTRTAGRDA